MDEWRLPLLPCSVRCESPGLPLLIPAVVEVAAGPISRHHRVLILPGCVPEEGTPSSPIL